jgi:hypothetical protein
MAPLTASMMLSMQAAVLRKESPVVLLTDRINEALLTIIALQTVKNKMLYR